MGESAAGVSDGPRSLVVDRSDAAQRAWVAAAVRTIEADNQRSADTHLRRFPLPSALPGIDLYLKDESTHVTGSLKHRLARSLFLYALCTGWLSADTTVIEASSGSTAVSEAYFARLIGLEFIAVMPARTSREKIELIQAQGGRCHLVDDPGTIYAESHRLADECGGHYMDQFTHAERATDWRGNNNIAESIFEQLALEPHPVPEWIVIGAGTGGTSATIGRYLRYRGHATRLCVPDPERSAFFGAWCEHDPARTAPGSRIEGIGRPRVEPSFVGPVIDRMLQVPDDASVATMREVETVLGRRVGPSTGTNLWASFGLAAEMARQGTAGSIVTLLCDAGDRYTHTYYDDGWVEQQGWDLAPARATVRRFLSAGTWSDDSPPRLRRVLRGAAMTDTRPALAALGPFLPDLLDDLRQLVLCESPSADLPAVHRSAQLVAEIGADRLGALPQWIEIDGCSHLAWRFGTGPRRVILLAHHDTVWPVGTLERLPWTVTPTVIRGPGTADMKAGLVLAMHALADLQAGGASLDGVTLLVTGDEELGSPTSRALIEREAAGCAGALVLEGAGPSGALKTGRKGISRYEVSITGRAAHAGGEPEKGVNAGIELAHLILAVATLHTPAAGTSVTPTAARAGTTSNTVPAHAVLQIDVRARTVAEQQRVHRALLDIRPRLTGSSWTVHGGPNRPPMEPASGAELFARADRLARRDGLGRLSQTSVGGASDGNFTAGIGVPTLDGLGAVGGGAHADDEHVMVDSLVPRTRLVSALVADLLGGG